MKEPYVNRSYLDYLVDYQSFEDIDEWCEPKYYEEFCPLCESIYDRFMGCDCEGYLDLWET